MALASRALLYRFDLYNGEVKLNRDFSIKAASSENPVGPRHDGKLRDAAWFRTAINSILN